MLIEGSPRDLPQWDSIAHTGPFYCSADWLAFSDSDGVAEAAYLGIHENGRPRALLPAHWSPEENNERYRPPTTGTLILGGRRGYLSAPLLADESDAEALPELVAAATGHFTSSEGRWWWPYLTGKDALVIAEALKSRPSTLSLHGADCVVDIPPGGLDQHICELPAKQRRTNARREIRAFAESGLELERSDLGGDEEVLGPLLSQVQQRYGYNHGPELMTGLLRRQSAFLRDRSVVFRCVDGDGTVIGFSLAYRHGSELALRVVGFDYSRLGNVGLYAQLGIYEPIRYCAENNLTRLHLGMESFETKIRRGAEPRPLWSLASGATGHAHLDQVCAHLTSAFPDRESTEFREEALRVTASATEYVPEAAGRKNLSIY